MRITHIHACTHTHIQVHMHIDMNGCTHSIHTAELLRAKGTARSSQEDHLPDPPLAHLNKPAGSPAFSIMHPLGTWSNPDLPGLPKPASPGGVPGPRAAFKPAERRAPSRKATVAVRQPAGSERPLLAGSQLAHLAEQRQWWLLLQPSLLPTGRASGP